MAATPDRREEGTRLLQVKVDNDKAAALAR
jgi:hypothetical protein